MSNSMNTLSIALFIIIPTFIMKLGICNLRRPVGLITLIALISCVVGELTWCDVEFRLWKVFDTTYQSQHWKQLTIAQLQQLKSQFVAQYNADGGLQPIASYNVGNCKVCQGTDIAVGYDWTNFVCPCLNDDNWIWSLSPGIY
eukprot:451118_1